MNINSYHQIQNSFPFASTFYFFFYIPSPRPSPTSSLLALSSSSTVARRDSCLHACVTMILSPTRLFLLPASCSEPAGSISSSSTLSRRAADFARDVRRWLGRAGPLLEEFAT